ERPGTCAIDCRVRSALPPAVTVGARSNAERRRAAREASTRASAARTSVPARSPSATSRVSVVSPSCCQNALCAPAARHVVINAGAGRMRILLRMKITFSDRERPPDGLRRKYGCRRRCYPATHDKTENEDIEQGRDNDAEAGHPAHAGEHGHAHDMAHLGAGAAGEDERDDAHDEGE